MSDIWIIVRNWERFQHYKDRRPVWIKTYTELTGLDEYRALSLAARGVLHGIWIEYSNARGVIKLGASLSQRLGQHVSKQQLDSLVDAGFIELSASRPTTQRASLETEKRREEPPLPPQGGSNASLEQNGRPAKISKRELAKFTGCKATKGSHGAGWKHTPLGTDPPPADWPHPTPTEPEVLAALAAADDFLAGMEGDE